MAFDRIWSEMPFDFQLFLICGDKNLGNGRPASSASNNFFLSNFTSLLRVEGF